MTTGSSASLPEGYSRIFVEKVSKLTVRKYDKVLYNTNNYGAERPADYTGSSAQHETQHWAAAAGREFHTVTIPASEVTWLIEAAKLALRLGKFPHHMYGEDLDDVVKGPLGKAFEDCVAAAKELHEKAGKPFLGFFVRSESVSLKDGQHGIGPYFTLRAILESIGSAGFAHSPLPREKNGNPIQLFLFPWRPHLIKAMEMRVFVHKGRVTAMSQQYLYTAFAEWQLMPLSDINHFAKRVLHHYETVVKNIVSYTDTFTYDLGLELAPCVSTSENTVEADDDANGSSDEPSGEGKEGKHSAEKAILDSYKRIVHDGVLLFIEPNPFGAAYPAGASLFDWKYDDARVTNTGGDVFVRLTFDDPTEEY